MNELIAFLAARLDEDEAWLDDYRSPVGDELRERMLREIAAKRQLMAEMVPWLNAEENEDWLNRGVGIQPPYEGSVRLLKILAAVYSGHPDYRPEWVTGSPASS